MECISTDSNISNLQPLAVARMTPTCRAAEVANDLFVASRPHKLLYLVLIRTHYLNAGSRYGQDNLRLKIFEDEE